MITCNRCGNLSPAGAVTCQVCGSPLSSRVEQGYATRMPAQDQPGLPAWLETLRASERPGAPANTAANFSTTEFVEDDSLPSWMRSERNDSQNTGSNPPISPSSPGFSISTPPGAEFPPSAFTAQSLIDEQALPSWMQESKLTPPPASPRPSSAQNMPQQDNVPDWMKSLQPQHGPSSDLNKSGERPPLSAEPSAPASGFSARDLIDQQALPSWMAAQGNQATSAPSGTASRQENPFGQAPSSSGFSARDLIDQQALPSWMVQQNNQPSAPRNEQSRQTPPAAQAPSSPGFSARDLIDQQALPSWMVPQANPGQAQGAQAKNRPEPQPVQQPQPSEQRPQPAQPSNPNLQKGFSARDLIDQQALPSWMAAQQGAQPAQGNAPAAPSEPAGFPPQPGQNGFAASSLLDMNSLPSWLREGAQQQPGNPASPAASWSGPSMQAPSPQSAPPQGGQMPGSSFIDMNSLPEWLRSGVEQQQPAAGQQYGQGAGSRPASPYSPPPRPEQVRVPSRPRGEVHPTESSEAAANVFASMLGVASASPNYPNPAGPQAGPNYAGPTTPPASPNPANPFSPPSGAPNPSYSQQGPMGQAATPGSGPGNWMGTNTPPGTPPGGPGAYGQSYPGGIPGTPNSAYPGTNQANQSQSSSIGVSQYSANMGGGMPASPRPSAAADDQRTPKKRNLFGAFLDWLAR